MSQNSAKDTFNEIIQVIQRTAELMETFGEADKEEREAVLSAYFSEALDSVGEKDDPPLPLIHTAEMLIDLATPKAAKLLGQGLCHPSLEIRILSGNALMHLAEEGLRAIQPAVDFVLEKGGVGAEEMPFILAEVDDAEVPRLLARFLASAEADVVASALEAVVECGDPESVADVEKLVGDSREVLVEEGEAEKTTIGQLAEDARDLLSEAE